MKDPNRFGILCSIFLIGGPGIWAQVKPVKKDNATEKKSHWIAELAYQSNDVYLGRRDSISVPYVTPSIGYHDRSGLFLAGSFSYLPKAGMSRIDVVTIEGGWSYTSDGLSAEVSAAKDFYSDQSYAVNSERKGRDSARVSYDLDFIEPSVDLGASFSDMADVGHVRKTGSQVHRRLYKVQVIRHTGRDPSLYFRVHRITLIAVKILSRTDFGAETDRK